MNHLEAEVIQDAQDVAVGMFPLESHLVKVLFDTGVMHSFVSTSWVEAHNIPIEPMTPPLRVNSVGGKVQSDRICPNLLPVEDGLSGRVHRRNRVHAG